MKTIIMTQTIPLLCKAQEEVDKLLEEDLEGKPCIIESDGCLQKFIDLYE